MKFGSVPPASMGHSIHFPPALAPKFSSARPLRESRFASVPREVVQEVQSSLQQPHFQPFQDSVEIRFAGGDTAKEDAAIVTIGQTGQTRNQDVLNGLIKAAMVKFGMRGEQVMPEERTIFSPDGDVFQRRTESQN